MMTLELLAVIVVGWEGKILPRGPGQKLLLCRTVWSTPGLQGCSRALL